MFELQKIEPPNPETNLSFASDVAANGSWLIIGAPDDEEHGEDAGAVFFYFRDDAGTPENANDDTWLFHSKVTVSDAAPGASLGQAVAIGDRYAFAKSIYGEVPGSLEGSVYVFRRHHNGTALDPADDLWVEEQKLIPTDASDTYFFGSDIAVDGDRVVIGKTRDDSACPGVENCTSGAAFVYERSDAGTPNEPMDDVWVETAKLIASDASEGDQFGGSVAIAGDRILVGARDDDDACPEIDVCFSGSAYVFQRTATSWIEETKLTASDAAQSDRFGIGVGLAEDWIIIGAQQGGPADDGAAYLFRRNGSTWVEHQILTATDGNEADEFGISVAIDGDRVVIGARLDDDACPLVDEDCDTGSAFTYHRDDGGTPADLTDDSWIADAKLVASDAGELTGHFLGSSVLLTDGLVVVGRRQTFGGSGSAHMFPLRRNADCNDNGFDDVCERAIDVTEDCQPNGAPDECDIEDGSSNDCNANGIPDECEPDKDCNESGVQDICDIGAGTSADCNENLVPDECELEVDCNSNGVPDDCDVADGTSDDCNANGVPDQCDVAAETSPDCNQNGAPDECDVADGTSKDCTGNGVPDECEPDCNDNNVADSCDIAGDVSHDCNFNSIPDECDIADGTSLDCNQNGSPDACDLTDGISSNCNGNDIPDECDIDNGTSEDCNSNVVPDDCDLAALTSFDCNDNEIPDECEIDAPPCVPLACCFFHVCEDLPIDKCVELGGVAAGSGSTCQTNDCPLAELVATSPDYTCDSSLPRVGNHVLRFTFHMPVPLPEAGEVEIRELLPDGEFGPDLSDQFSFSLEDDDHVLRVAENGIVLEHLIWYGIMNTGHWASVNPFEVDYVVIRGDANNDAYVSLVDLSAINAFIAPPADTPDDSRFDINGVGGVSFIDLSAAYAYFASTSSAKPDGHGCLP